MKLKSTTEDAARSGPKMRAVEEWCKDQQTFDPRARINAPCTEKPGFTTCFDGHRQAGSNHLLSSKLSEDLCYILSRPTIGHRSEPRTQCSREEFERGKVQLDRDYRARGLSGRKAPDDVDDAICRTRALTAEAIAAVLRTFVDAGHDSTTAQLTNSQLRQCGVYVDEDDEEVEEEHSAPAPYPYPHILQELQCRGGFYAFEWQTWDDLNERAELNHGHGDNNAERDAEAEPLNLGHRRARSNISICLSDISEDLCYVMYPWTNGHYPKSGERVNPKHLVDSHKVEETKQDAVGERSPEGLSFGTSRELIDRCNGTSAEMSDSCLRECGVFVDEEEAEESGGVDGASRYTLAADFVEEEGPRQLPPRVQCSTESRDAVECHLSEQHAVSGAPSIENVNLSTTTPARARPEHADPAAGGSRPIPFNILTPPHTDPKLALSHTHELTGSPSPIPISYSNSPSRRPGRGLGLRSFFGRHERKTSIREARMAMEKLTLGR
ncbi:hypothetical protein BOTBODRAFT_146063 [Botryobasidium botryosum FD-172 SS1]|uniref:Uncharacterized protein n=1 Tax=Botryobasidium botryosum (strain FD-172 SS1) TaxID=930990 RepID=A0A067MDN3_BOTB1|nr:hypothetical protein BOTBODRAFT_146063 [Botryobasidium botryosum FD-172 SS1]